MSQLKPRIVSLLPSATEIVWALGASDQLVGISHECDFPQEVRTRRILTRSRVDASATSREIDAAVRAAAHEALSIYAVDQAVLRDVEPEVILTQDLCEVCAVSLDDVRSAVARLAHRDHVQIVSLRPTRLLDLFGDIERVGEAIGCSSAQVNQSLKARMTEIEARSACSMLRPRVVSIEWMEPLMLGGTWMPELIERAGGLAAGVSAGVPAPTVSPSDLKALDPDVVILKPCGFSLQRALQETEVIERNVLSHLSKRARAYVTDGNAYFNRPGPRLVESLEIMAACVHPSIFGDFGNKHRDVIRRL